MYVRLDLFNFNIVDYLKVPNKPGDYLLARADAETAYRSKRSACTRF